ncbi:MAG: MacB family efflux pump subunit [Methylophilaceae bacterium]|nr:MacB family efflux pump subunit [Methylophilaceae bacterium]
MQKPILELTNINKQFQVDQQSIHILNNINLAIQAGSMVAIVGASGSGKSTLLNILGCLDHPSSGHYLVDGRDTALLDSDELAQLRSRYFGFVFQRYHLLPNLSALENVEIPAIYAGIPSGERRSSAIKLLTKLGLGERIAHQPHQLSGGQQQRVSIARALLNGGKVILADEPTGALDSESGQEMMQILHELHQQGHTIIIVTHDMEIASHAERIIEIRDGSIIGDRANIREHIPSPPDSRLSGTNADKPQPSRQSGLKRLGEAVHMARLALASQRLRTALTMLGIIIGIASVVAINAIGEGGQQHIKETIGPLTSNRVEIRRGSGWGDSQAPGIHSLLPGDVASIQAQSYVDSVTPMTPGNFSIRYANAIASATVTGVSESFFNVRGIIMAQGRSFSADDIQRQAQVVVIDQEARQKLFEREQNPIGQVIIIGNVPCTVIGVTSHKSKDLFAAAGPNLLMPYTTAGIRLFGYQHFDSITVRLREDQNSQLAEKNLNTLLSYRHGSKDFFTDNMDTLAKAYEKTTRSISLMLSWVASIALMVGGIGVMNIMLVSVTERTREIGIRMAVGARRSDIMQQFLVEAVVICFIGGILGLLLAFLSGYLFSLFVVEWKMIFTTNAILLAFACSTLIGMSFGYLPARRASQLHPHDALSRD